MALSSMIFVHVRVREPICRIVWLFNERLLIFQFIKAVCRYLRWISLGCTHVLLSEQELVWKINLEWKLCMALLHRLWILWIRCFKGCKMSFCKRIDQASINYQKFGVFKWISFLSLFHHEFFRKHVTLFDI